MCDTAPTSTQLATEARALLAGAPEEFVARRDARAKELRAAGDRGAAADVKALTKPTIALWCVLAAGADTEAVDEAYASTDALVSVQAAASDRDEVRAATARRRDAIDRLVQVAVALVAGGTDARTHEVRDLLERLTRQPDLREPWVEGTLRDIPEAGLGFEAFAAFAPPASARAPSRSGAPPPSKPPARAPAARAAAPSRQPPASPARDAAAERARLAEERERERAARAAARAEIAAAEKALASARRQLAISSRAKEAADAAFDAATDAVVAAEARLQAARRPGDDG